MTILIVALVFACMAAGLAALLRRCASSSSLPVTTEWIDELSVQRYLPMLGLLKNEDLRFLRTQPGYTPLMEHALHLRRCRIFRGYLRDLMSDFSRICRALKVLMVQANCDRPDLAAVLVRTQVAFACAVVVIQFRLALYRCGLGSVDVSALVKLFDSMRLELRTLVPAESW